jgi:hypothetical protein
VKCLLSCLLLLGLGACQAFTRPDVPATLRAENVNYVREATSIYEMAQAENSRLEVTVAAAAATIARIDNVNQQLMTTARAVIPPTAQIAGAGISAPTMSASGGSDGTQFVEVGTTGTVNDSDGCAMGLQSEFVLGSGFIYVTTRALNIRAGTLMGVEWWYEGAVAHQENFVVPVDDDNYCIWFNLEPFSPGSWRVRLYQNEVLIEPEVAFNVLGAVPAGG